MAKPHWNRRLGEVLQQYTRKVTLMGNKGKEYQTEVVPVLEVVSTGSVEEVFKDGVNDGFKYAIVDTVHQLEYEIKAPKEEEVIFGSVLKFYNVTGGQLNNSSLGWYKAENVEVLKYK